MRCAGVVVFAAFLAGCGGARILKEPLSLPASGPLASAADEHLEAELRWVIVRDGPGSWASHVDWDQYLFQLKSLSDHNITVVEVAVHDSLGKKHTDSAIRSDLVAQSRQTARRYRKQGLKVEAGMGASALLASGAVSYVAGSGLGIAVLSGSAGAGAAGVAIGAIVAGPALAIGGVVRGINNSRVADEIETRSTRLPLTIAAADGTALNLFFSLAPEPRKVEFTYLTNNDATRVLTIEPLTALHGLHLDPGTR